MFQAHSIAHSEWLVPSRYRDLVVIGYGAYGSVCSAFDEQLQRQVAIKKLARPFLSPSYAKVTYRELMIMHHMDHENIVCLVDAFSPQTSRETFADVYFVTPWIGPDLSTYIATQEILNEHVQFFVYQMLRALKYVHSTGIIHRDLKPANITVSSDCELKILDFGLARQVEDDMTIYVVTRWYRAPEVLLSWSHYNDRVDIWAVGCIMGELFHRGPLFPGNDLFDQWRKITELVGNPDDEFMEKIESEDTRTIIRGKMVPSGGEDFVTFFRRFNTDENAIDLLGKMLTLDPDRRISATEALEHPYLADYHDETDEPTGPLFVDSMETRIDVEVDQWKDLVWSVLADFSPNIKSLNKLEKD